VVIACIDPFAKKDEEFWTMFRFLLTLALIAVVAYFWVRSLRRISPPPPAQRSESVDPGTALVQDPNCQTYLSIEDALKVARGGETHYFCSPECAAAFEKKKREKTTGG
jgi:YHS domain-containing protein